MSQSIHDCFHIKDGFPDPPGIALGLTCMQARLINMHTYTMWQNFAVKEFVGEVRSMKFLHTNIFLTKVLLHEYFQIYSN